MKIKEAVVERIKALTFSHGISIYELANQAGVTPSTAYSLLDPTRKNASIITIKKLCDGLGITLGEFFSDPIFDSLPQELE